MTETNSYSYDESDNNNSLEELHTEKLVEILKELPKEKLVEIVEENSDMNLIEAAMQELSYKDKSYALKKGIEFLVNNAFDPYERNKQQSTPLIKATARSNGPGFDIFKLLLEHNPDIYWKNKSGMSCLVLAEETRDFFEDPTIYNYLVEKGLVKE